MSAVIKCQLLASLISGAGLLIAYSGIPFIPLVCWAVAFQFIMVPLIGRGGTMGGKKSAILVSLIGIAVCRFLWGLNWVSAIPVGSCGAEMIVAVLGYCRYAFGRK